jgi:hypothetical protein
MMPLNRLNGFRLQNPLQPIGGGTAMQSTAGYNGTNNAINVSGGFNADGSASAQTTAIVVIVLAAVVVLAHWGLR